LVHLQKTFKAKEKMILQERKEMPMTGKKCYSYLRFSTSEQAEGDSKRRQIAYAEKWAKKNNIPLDDKLTFQDLGLSAFNGHHRTKGALSKFLHLIEEGKIPKGSTLIIEAMDRLSREKVIDALYQFMGIIRAGIKVVTASDGYEYDTEMINNSPFQLMYSIMLMTVAHEESKKKSKRLKEAWVGKREEIGKYKLTGRAPAWLEAVRLPPKREGEPGPIVKFAPVKERADIIQRIFRMKLDGKGSEKIAKELNQTDGIWSPKNGWRRSYVNKILRTRAVIGEYQPHQLAEKKAKDGTPKKKRIPKGNPISDYFPAVVNEDVFYQVQSLIKQNKGSGGKNGAISNLFSLIAKCGYCGAPMRLLNKGTPPRGQKYYCCDAAIRGIGCHKKNIRYDEIEKLILTYCKGLSPDDILPKDNHKSEISLLQDQLASVSGKIASLQSRDSNLAFQISNIEKNDKDVAARLLKELSNVLKEIKHNQKEQANIEDQVHQLLQVEQDTEKQLQSMAELLELMGSLDGQELIDLRTRLREAIRRIIDTILIFPVGQHRWTEKELAEHGNEIVDELLHQGWEKEKVNEFIDTAFDSIDNTDYRSYFIRFKSGAERVIKPRLDKKLSVDIERKEGFKGIPIYLDMSSN
jgi:DNA invertase Pin-like site-specific DNA recombinase